MVILLWLLSNPKKEYVNIKTNAIASSGVSEVLSFYGKNNEIKKMFKEGEFIILDYQAYASPWASFKEEYWNVEILNGSRKGQRLWVNNKDIINWEKKDDTKGKTEAALISLILMPLIIPWLIYKIIKDL
jgi:hypothetical protein